MFFQMKTPQNTQHNKWQQHKDSQPGIPLWNFGQTEYSKGLWDLKKKKKVLCNVWEIIIHLVFHQHLKLKDT